MANSCQPCADMCVYTPDCKHQREVNGATVWVCEDHATGRLSISTPTFGKAPSVKGSPTSEAAARSVDGSVPVSCAKAYQAILNAGSGGLTRDEVCRLTGLLNQAACARLRTLEERGKIVAHKTWTRKASTGRSQQVYTITEQARDAA